MIALGRDLLAAAGVRPRAVDEPDGYRMSDYDAPVPETLTGAHVVDDDAAHALWLTGRVVIFDVMPDLPRPEEPAQERASGRAASGTRSPARSGCPMPASARCRTKTCRDVRGRSCPSTPPDDPAAPILFLCRADCWMSWNAARRALTLGYARVFWYPAGTTGWEFWDWPVERLRKLRR